MESTAQILCNLLWKLCRKHGWATPIEKEGLVDLALKSSDQGRGKELVETLIDEPYIGHQRGKGYSIKNNPDAQAQAAYRLKNYCGYTEIQIETTLSRFEAAGGFDAYDEEEMMKSLNDW